MYICSTKAFIGMYKNKHIDIHKEITYKFCVSSVKYVVKQIRTDIASDKMLKKK